MVLDGAFRPPCGCGCPHGVKKRMLLHACECVLGNKLFGSLTGVKTVQQ